MIGSEDWLAGALELMKISVPKMFFCDTRTRFNSWHSHRKKISANGN